MVVDGDVDILPTGRGAVMALVALAPAIAGDAVKRLSILTPDRRAKLTPLSGTAEVVPVVNRGGYLLTHRGNRAAGTAGGGSGAVLEAPALVAGLDDLAMMGETVE